MIHQEDLAEVKKEKVKIEKTETEKVKTEVAQPGKPNIKAKDGVEVLIKQEFDTDTEP